MDASLDRLAGSIKTNSASGSTEITIKTCELMERALSSGVSREGLEPILLEILEIHRPMALLHRCVRHFLGGGNPRDFLNGMRDRTEKAGRNAGAYLEKAGVKSVMTISSSSAVEFALSSFDGVIYVMESRPVLEGIDMAGRLAKKGRDVTVISDAYGISMVARGEVEAVMVGADAIYRNMLINKVGTYALSAAAEHSGAEFIAVLTTDKMFPADVELSGDEIMQYHDPGEIAKSVRASNPYFEAVPIRKGMSVFTENGLLYPNEK